MLDRLLLALIICIAGVVLWRGYNRYSLRRLATTPVGHNGHRCWR